MKRCQKRKLLVILSIIICLSLVSQPVNAASGSFSEDFSTTTYMDAENTNATGWGSGFVEIPNKQLELAGVYYLSGVIVDIVIEGEFAYVTDGSFHILNITNMSDPSPLGVAPVSGFISIEGDYAFVSEGSASGPGSSLRVVDISDPTNPILLSKAAQGGGHICVSGNYAYCASGAAGLRIVNITDPYNPELVGTLPKITHDFLAVCVSGSFVFVTESYCTRVVDVVDPKNPVLVSTILTDGEHRAIAVSGLYIFIGGDTKMLISKDISNPLNRSL